MTETLRQPPAHGTAFPAVADHDDLSPHRYIVYASVVVALLMITIDATITATALSSIHRTLHATINWAAWTITIYGLGMVVFLPISGRLTDRFGMRRVFLWGVVVFTLASLACGFASNVYWLIVFRALQSIGGGALIPCTAGIAAETFGRNRDRALGMFGTFGSVGQIVGPVLGGLFVGYLSWRWIFWINGPIGALLVVLIVRFVPESRKKKSEKTDLQGLLLVALFILCAIFGITSLGSGRTAITTPIVLVPEAAAIVLLVASIRHERRTTRPFIPVQLLRGRGFGALNLQNLLLGIVTFGVASLVPLYAQQRYHLAALSAGTLLTAVAVGMIVVSTATTFAMRRTGCRVLFVVGLVLLALGLLLLSMSPQWGFGAYAWLSIGSGITGLGNGVLNPASRNACMELVPDKVSLVIALRTMFNYVGIIFSVSIVTAILSRSAHPGLAQAHVYWFLIALIGLVMVPLTWRIPNHKGGW